MPHLKEIVSYGVRHTGSKANEEQTPKYDPCGLLLLCWVAVADFFILFFFPHHSYIKQQVDKLRGQLPEGVELEFEVQRPSGSLYLDFINGFTSAYRHVANVLVRVSHSPAAKGKAAAVSGGGKALRF